jgi:hypothetical protein
MLTLPIGWLRTRPPSHATAPPTRSDRAVCVHSTQVYVNSTQVCVNPTQVYVNPTQVYVNPTQVYVNSTQVATAAARQLVAVAVLQAAKARHLLHLLLTAAAVAAYCSLVLRQAHTPQTFATVAAVRSPTRYPESHDSAILVITVREGRECAEPAGHARVPSAPRARRLALCLPLCLSHCVSFTV